MIIAVNNTLKYPVFLLLLALFFTACAQVPRVDHRGLPQRKYVYQEPEPANDGWETASLSQGGVDPGKINEMMHEILAGKSRYLHSILLIKNGKLVFEEYFFGYSRGTNHFQASVSKSVTSLIIGVAINKGYVPDVDTLAYKIFSDYRRSKWIEQKYPIRLKHMLTMTAGLDWDALSHRRSHPGHTTYQMYASRDPVEFVLNRNLSDIPGQKYNYNSGLTILQNPRSMSSNAMTAVGFRWKLARFRRKSTARPCFCASFAILPKRNNQWMPCAGDRRNRTPGRETTG